MIDHKKFFQKLISRPNLFEPQQKSYTGNSAKLVNDAAQTKTKQLFHRLHNFFDLTKKPTRIIRENSFFQTVNIHCNGWSVN